MLGGTPIDARFGRAMRALIDPLFVVHDVRASAEPADARFDAQRERAGVCLESKPLQMRTAVREHGARERQ
jgi:hypothetical protein